MDTLKNLLNTLNLSDKDGLTLLRDMEGFNLEKFPNRIKEAIKEINPDAIFCINNEPLLLFFENPKNLEALQQKIWNFNQAPAIFIHNREWIVKNGFNLLKGEKVLETIAEGNNIYDFEYFKLITGETWENYKSKFEQKNRVDTYLLENIETARSILTNKKQPNFLPSRVANSLIGRVIFIRYLLDRKVELGAKYSINTKEDFYNLLLNPQKTYSFFQKIKEDFNGNLFPLTYEVDGEEINEKDYVKVHHLNTIYNLLKGNKLYENSVQKSLFDIYDFSIIPIEFVSNVYEKFIGVDKQADSGAYYTPLFLVDYIQKETVSKYFEANPNEYNCKVLDPACGSGIFLVETLRQIIFQYQKLNPTYKDNYSQYKDILKQILKDNIFGVDKDENAISVAIFSLYITLLDNLSPKSIVGFQFPELIGSNFFSNDFFDIRQKFDAELKKHHFQFVLGNPPWGVKHKGKQLFESYIENRKKEEKSTLEIVHREIAEAFLVRVSDFNFDETAFIVVSKILYKISRKKNKKGIFRNYFFNNFKIRQVFELSSVRHQVFGGNTKKKNEDKGIAPATILFYSKSNSNEFKNNVIRHISLKPNIFFETFKLMVIEKYDIKEVTQTNFIEEDWIWKVLVYGNILDYYFVKRLKENKPIYDYISDKKEFVFGKGISIGGGDKNSILEHKKIAYSINSKGKGLKPYFIDYTNNFLGNLEYVHRPRKLSLFKSTVLLVGKGVSNDFKCKSAISLIDVIYTDAITGIKPLTDNAVNIIYILQAFFNSNLFSYFLVSTNSSIGIEREQSHDKDDKFSIPLIINDNYDLKPKVLSLIDLKKKESEKFFEDVEKQLIKKNILALENEIDATLFKIYSISNQERALIDYKNSITIPLLKGKDLEKKKVIGKLDYQSNILNQYAQVFIDHFGKRFNSENKYFEVEIIYSQHTILMKFKIVPTPSKHSDCAEWKQQGDKELLRTITALQFENLSDNLFIQKDVKGFEEDFFYVAKPNQYKSWHQALAYLDLSEFIQALHNSNL